MGKKDVVVCPFCGHNKLILLDEITGNNSRIFMIFECEKCNKIFIGG